VRKHAFFSSILCEICIFFLFLLCCLVAFRVQKVLHTSIWGFQYKVHMGVGSHNPIFWEHGVFLISNIINLNLSQGVKKHSYNLSIELCIVDHTNTPQYKSLCSFQIMMNVNQNINKKSGNCDSIVAWLDCQVLQKHDHIDEIGKLDKNKLMT
jgi:hypothetical protein